CAYTEGTSAFSIWFTTDFGRVIQTLSEDVIH
ncbi:uncharacterized protein METZ01_LOCUS393082, partial [marine metagenome]